MKVKSNLKKFVVSAFCFSLLGIAMLSSTAYARRAAPTQIVNPVSFETNKNVKVFKSNVSGTSYGWKILIAIRISRPGYNEAVNKLWENADIPVSERTKYQLVNIRQEEGTDWGIMICGQNYLTVTADIAESE